MHFCVSLLICLLGRVFVQENCKAANMIGMHVKRRLISLTNVTVISSFLIIYYAGLCFNLRSIIVHKITFKNSFSVITVDLVDE